MTPKKLRSVRQESDIKLRVLAERIGVKPWTLCRWERGQRSATPAELKVWHRELKREAAALEKKR